MKIAAVIATNQRPDWLERTVRSLLTASSEVPSLDLVFIVHINGEDQKSSIKMQELIEEFGTKRFSVIFSKEKKTPAKARNQALPRADAEWVLFIDDDAYVETGFFMTFRKALAAFPMASAIGGPNLTPPGSSVFQVATGMILSTRLGAYSSYVRYRIAGNIRASGEDSLILCNLFVKKECLGSNPFPEDFLCNEENWMLQTLQARGRQIVYDPHLSVNHERRASLGRFLKQVFIYGFGRGQNIRLRPQTFRWAHILPSICTLAGIVSIVDLIALRRMPIFMAALFGIYAVLCLVSGFSFQNLAASALSPLLYPLLHVSYGFGVLCGSIQLSDGNKSLILWRNRPRFGKR